MPRRDLPPELREPIKADGLSDTQISALRIERLQALADYLGVSHERSGWQAELCFRLAENRYPGIRIAKSSGRPKKYGPLELAMIHSESLRIQRTELQKSIHRLHITDREIAVIMKKESGYSNYEIRTLENLISRSRRVAEQGFLSGEF